MECNHAYSFEHNIGQYAPDLEPIMQWFVRYRFVKHLTYTSDYYIQYHRVELLKYMWRTGQLTPKLLEIIIKGMARIEGLQWLKRIGHAPTKIPGTLGSMGSVKTLRWFKRQGIRMTPKQSLSLLSQYGPCRHGFNKIILPQINWLWNQGYYRNVEDFLNTALNLEFYNYMPHYYGKALEWLIQKLKNVKIDYITYGSRLCDIFFTAQHALYTDHFQVLFKHGCYPSQETIDIAYSGISYNKRQEHMNKACEALLKIDPNSIKLLPTDKTKIDLTKSFKSWQKPTAIVDYLSNHKIQVSDF